MAIAPLDTAEGLAFDEALAAWPRPEPTLAPCHLRLVGAGAEEEPDLAVITPIGAHPAHGHAVRQGPDVSQRRAARRQLAIRRRRLGLGVLAIGLLAGLALPAGAWGGRSPDATQTAAATLPGAADAGSGVVYTVRSGDTLDSVAARIDPAQPAREARLIARETGSTTLVPGQHFLVP
jgi:hypothetical protein